MDPVSIVALVLSIIAILLWLYSFLFSEKNSKVKETENPPQARPMEEPGQQLGMPDILRQEGQLKVLQQQVQWESRFMAETQKFSQMVRKNLEMLNTRVGIKFDVKPISDDFKKMPKGPEFVDSMEVADSKENDFEAEAGD